ncbi:phosphatase PAP2 family protein [Sphingomonas sp. ID1715]|uniref:phosphatase PAP2 family protein n=1 Tax=Sphingomonas sp. ID1715 TaxID=1656898 RepID=UPI00148A0CF1|nr:phosphatase PAP2 family protein [Sphingomonas sp. ID1715]NNM77740.1 phosphatase PAP2 family protein [Sphingomonas sp. ID1715]
MSNIFRTNILGAAVALSLPAAAAARDAAAWDSAGGIARDALVVAALGVPAIKGDWRGDAEAGASLGSAALATYGLKRAFPELRPDGSDRKSFPSGHSSISFAAAATLQNRYGWRIGLPAQLVAGFVGISRIEARKHHWYDVVAGAAVGEASGFLLTTRRNSSVRVLPWAGSGDAGVTALVRF